MREFYGILILFSLFGVEFHPVNGATVLRLVWMVELLFLTSPLDNDTSSTYFQTQDSGSEILKLLIITKNNIGPSFVPWGMLAFVGSQWEIDPVNLISWTFSKKSRKNEICKANHSNQNSMRKFNFRRIIPGKKFPKIWIHLTRLFLGALHLTQIS